GIQFNVAGTVRLTSGALPALTGTAYLDGTTAPGFAGRPLVEVDCNHFGGLRFNPGSSGSTLLSLAITDAADSGVGLFGAGSVFVAGNFIGLRLDGTTAAGNGGNGIVLSASSGNTIGGTGAQLRNVISANSGNGICVRMSSGNQILGNYVGTDATGML